MSDWRAARTVEHRDTSLGFAVRLADARTGERPSADVEVSLAALDVEPVVNPSGYHVFFELPVETVTLVVDGTERYFDEERRVHLHGEAPPADDPTGVVLDDRTIPVVVELTPTPAYEFPETATTVRGHVETDDGAPIEGAIVTLPAFDVATRTTATGEYALWVPVTSDDVVRENGRKYVRVDGGAGENGRGVANGRAGRDPTLAVTHPSYPDHEEQLAVEAGTRTVHYVTLTG